MQSSNRFAFKEWAAVCAALAAGRQSLIFRKGGIHEGAKGFEVEHSEFWLFPTRFHQQPEELTADAGTFLEAAARQQAPPGQLRILLYAVVHEVVRIENEDLIARLEGQHIWSDRVIDERFHYRTPGLWALVVRVYARRQPLLLPDSPHFAGCKTWVEFPEVVATESLQPVLSDEAFAGQYERIGQALGTSGFA